MATRKITLFFDLQSPYSYLTFHCLRNLSSFQICEVDYVPVLLVAFPHLQQPWNNDNKVKWLMTDLTRSAEEHNVPWRVGWPANYPARVTTLKVQRALLACSIQCPEYYIDVLGALYHAFWVEKESVQLSEIFTSVLEKRLGILLAAKVIAKASSEEVKLLLRQNTERALASGAPGVPWLKATNLAGEDAYFWGFDHLGQAAKFLTSGRYNSHL